MINVILENGEVVLLIKVVLILLYGFFVIVFEGYRFGVIIVFKKCDFFVVNVIRMFCCCYK